ncbi:MAG: CRISPR-associated endonuclease Cas2 [Candidatus Staskawiczbacteria bacterium RIFOXYB1_FULL_32_11]|uniref:CRISPR-associated endonuclease Cas2 n=1 Tax=Candidatus Staskawiczbacteria bacterium RIFOXYD1_FULL_32_13 TaxID=1802234 RepID=A0A1G2JL44_9BACT|nr:MAG: CRISPR-associated endonuclease Cas2 [Candidatus Staskawiczbacteria bacterium RIFOXYA2_FULL_32_7]OGZ78407.1 MAG: CRISPR-associated endonuclease Cas2 [Candidatus Staskawiczbacteria bacterium RIFOXYB1_FULL_32_11]OGZ86399.1 MAG: CRISPR-associated endonuclease Cas2 [Candidatus Staskawiczbacteria bacterium RIFOXYC2_FULL_32_10]OGZ87849.1 MAG: CRISPR-associated endonuclease Cas2 [Candidatus Staskawiczbacteria bacterium RIFOXYD1_FULL_32_13]
MRKRYGEITKDILSTMAVAGLITVAVTLSPNLLYNIAKEIIKIKKKDWKYKNTDARKLSRSLAGLNKNKIIILKEVNGKFVVELTEKGRRVVGEIQFENMEIKKQKVWDGKWRIVIFDIPENQRRVERNALRGKLQNLGFYQIQKSVWAYPYPCEKEIQFLCEMFNINPYVNIITAEKIYNDDSMKKHFKL